MLQYINIVKLSTVSYTNVEYHIEHGLHLSIICQSANIIGPCSTAVSIVMSIHCLVDICVNLLIVLTARILYQINQSSTFNKF